MRKLLGILAAALGLLGALACAALIGLGWWAAVRTAGRVTQAAERVEQRLAEADKSLSRTEERLAAIRADVDDVRGEADRLIAANPELPQVRAALERLIDRLVLSIGRAAALSDSLLSVAAGLRAAADIRDLVAGENEPPDRARNAADMIDQAAGTLNIPQARINALKSATAVRMVRELVDMAREAAAGSARLAEGLALSRRAIATARDRSAEYREKLVFWVYIGAIVNTLVWLWLGLGQLCLIGWGRRQFTIRTGTYPSSPRPT
jgi:hypothetical protein